MRRDTTLFVPHAAQKQEALRVHNINGVDTLTYALPGSVVEGKTFRAGLRRDGTQAGFFFNVLFTAEAHKTSMQSEFNADYDRTSLISFTHLPSSLCKSMKSVNQKQKKKCRMEALTCPCPGRTHSRIHSSGVNILQRRDFTGTASRKTGSQLPFSFKRP